MVRKIGKRARSPPAPPGPLPSSFTHSELTHRVQASLEALNQGPLPGLVVFDLDYTLWPLWVDTHVDPPLTRRGNDLNKVHDRNGQPLGFFPHVPSILFWLRRRGIAIASASRTSAPTAARQALTGLHLVQDSNILTGEEPSVVRAIDLFDYHEIYPGSKLTHFRKLNLDSGIDFDDMLFFDDEHRNAEVGKLGVHFVLVGHSGTDLATFEKGLREWRAKKQARANSTTQES